MIPHPKRILVTKLSRPNDPLIAELTASGAQVTHIPLIAIADPGDAFSSLDAALRDIDVYQWLLFTSQTAVEKCFSRPVAPALEEVAAHIAAVGPRTAQLLCELGARDVLVPQQHSAQGLLAQMQSIAVAGQRALFPRAREGLDDLADGLRARGMQVEVVEAYRIVPAPEENRARIAALLRAGLIDAVHFASPSAEKAFERLVQEENLEEEVRALNRISQSPQFL